MKLFMAFAAALFLITSVRADETKADSTAPVYHELSWKEPPKELLEQQYCPIDSSADAEIVQKEMRFSFDIPYLDVIYRTRIKIYTENGLQYAQVRQEYEPLEEITSIEATCYNPDGSKTELARKDIHDEIILKNQKKGWKEGAKSFAMPNVAPGSVIDITMKITYSGAITPPPFRFQEEIPVGIARFYMIPPLYLHYTYSVTNDALLHPVVYYNNHDLVCDATNIPAIESETYRPPERDLSTDFWICLKEFKYDMYKFEYADCWKTLLTRYAKYFNEAYDNSKQAEKLADSLMSATQDRTDRIRQALKIVQTRWDSMRLFQVGGPSDDINSMMKEKELDGEDKAIVLCSILTHMNIPSEIVWVCSDHSYYSPLDEVPTLRMFDHALTYIPDDTLFLDPGDPGSEVGVLDDALWGRMMCRPMATNDFISKTPSLDKSGGTMVNLQLNMDGDNAFSGQATITFVNQSAIEARRVFRKQGLSEKTNFITALLLRDCKDAVDSISPAPDSVQTPLQFQVTCNVHLKNLVESDAPNFDLSVFPGKTFKSTVLDLKPPRKYPIYFTSQNRTVYIIEWNFGDNYRPLNTEGLNLSVDGILQTYSLLSEYDQAQNRLTIRRQLNRPQKLFQPDFAPAYEKFLENVQKCDLSTIVVVKK